MEFKIRMIKLEEYQYFETFLYEAIFQKDEPKVPFDIIYQPDIYNYIKDFGKKDDLCLVALVNEEVVGMVWTRVLDGSIKGFGNIGKGIPEYAISILPEYRKRGIGKALLLASINLLKEKGYKEASLGVQKDNYAYKLYTEVGFKVVRDSFITNEYIMRIEL